MKKVLTALILTLVMIMSAFTLVGCDEEDTHVHTFADKWSTDESYHWHAATCGHDEFTDKGSHAFVGGKCSVCGYSDPDYNPNQGGGSSGEDGDEEKEVRYTATEAEWEAAFDLGDNFTVQTHTRHYNDGSGSSVFAERKFDGDKEESYSYLLNSPKGNASYKHFQDETTVWLYRIVSTDEGYIKSNYAEYITHTDMADYRRFEFNGFHYDLVSEYLIEHFESMTFSDNKYSKSEVYLHIEGTDTTRMTTYGVVFKDGKLDSLNFSVNSSKSGETQKIVSVTITDIGKTKVELPENATEKPYDDGTHEERMVTSQIWDAELGNFGLTGFSYETVITDKEDDESYQKTRLVDNKYYFEFSSEGYSGAQYVYYESDNVIWLYTPVPNEIGIWTRENIFGKTESYYVQATFAAQVAEVTANFDDLFLKPLEGKFDDAEYNWKNQSYKINGVHTTYNGYDEKNNPVEEEYTVDYKIEFWRNRLNHLEATVYDASKPGEPAFATVKIEAIYSLALPEIPMAPPEEPVPEFRAVSEEQFGKIKDGELNLTDFWIIANLVYEDKESEGYNMENVEAKFDNRAYGDDGLSGYYSMEKNKWTYYSKEIDGWTKHYYDNSTGWVDEVVDTDEYSQYFYANAVAKTEEFICKILEDVAYGDLKYNGSSQAYKVELSNYTYSYKDTESECSATVFLRFLNGKLEQIEIILSEKSEGEEEGAAMGQIIISDIGSTNLGVPWKGSIK